MKNTLKRFKEINEFFEATGFENRTDISDFFVFSLNDIPKSGIMSMQPYQKNFYHITLVLKAEKSEITIDEQHNTSQENFLFFLSTEHIYSWKRDFNVKGFTIFLNLPFLIFIQAILNRIFLFLI